jgi:hypothetical protein
VELKTAFANPAGILVASAFASWLPGKRIAAGRRVWNAGSGSGSVVAGAVGRSLRNNHWRSSQIDGPPSLKVLAKLVFNSLAVASLSVFASGQEFVNVNLGYSSFGRK